MRGASRSKTRRACGLAGRVRAAPDEPLAAHSYRLLATRNVDTEAWAKQLGRAAFQVRIVVRMQRPPHGTSGAGDDPARRRRGGGRAIQPRARAWRPSWTTSTT